MEILGTLIFAFAGAIWVFMNATFIVEFMDAKKKQKLIILKRIEMWIALFIMEATVGTFMAIGLTIMVKYHQY